MFLYGICQALSSLISKIIYNRNKNLNPYQLLFGRSSMASLVCIIIVNKNLKEALYDSVPKH